MDEIRPSVPKGTRDFSPSEMLKRNYIFDTIRNIFKLFGFQQIETPAMENLSSLLGKYGDEGDKLLFRILNSGNFLSGVDTQMIHDSNYSVISNLICEKGLRYDLTVPFARYVAQHRNEINFPFKRYQIQPVWRADRPQKGRYREFYQCDADTIGSNSLLNELELIKIIDMVFKELEIPVIIKLNNRKILAGIAEIIGESDKLTDITVTIDKLDKIGKANALIELEKLGVNKAAIKRIIPLLELSGQETEKLEFLTNFMSNSETGKKGVEELKNLFHLLSFNEIENEILFDIKLARGLNYYTGAIIEVSAKNVSIGSICGGGRYDNLTGYYGLTGVSGVGISFGADRIYDVLDQLKLFPEVVKNKTQILFINFGQSEVIKILPVLNKLRNAGINVELYPDADKIKKQMNYANNNKIPFVALIGEQELKENLITLKNMDSGEQLKLKPEDVIQTLDNHIK